MKSAEILVAWTRLLQSVDENESETRGALPDDDWVRVVQGYCACL